jgi:hypothetical protein
VPPVVRHDYVLPYVVVLTFAKLRRWDRLASQLLRRPGDPASRLSPTECFGRLGESERRVLADVTAGQRLPAEDPVVVYDAE